MYLKCPVTFQENTCILIFCMYFTRIPNESKIHFGIHIRYIKIHVSWTLPWCHTGYISGYIRIRVSWTLHHDTSYDTSGYTEIQNHDTCILDASWRGTYLRCKIHSEYIRDTCEIHVSARVIKIHAGYIQDTWWDTCISNASRERCIWYEGDMRDTCKIHARYMYPQR